MNTTSDSSRSRIRTAALWLVAMAGLVFAAWALTRYAQRRAVEQKSGLPGAEEETASGGVNTAGGNAAAPGGVVARVLVRAQEGDRDMPLGAALSERVALKMTGAIGQPYEARFDRVGVWQMEVPPGVYDVPAKQPEIRGWKWKLSGDGVAKGKAGMKYTVKFETSRSHPGLELHLSR
jgi:hypothetical protein